MKLRSPIMWFGGKGHMTAKLLPLLPPHAQYSEPFFGGGSLFFAKPPCPHETINDIDEGVTGFFRVLRDRGEEFIRRAALTEYGEALYRDCRATWREEPDELLRAWRWWVVARQSFSGSFGSSHGHTRTAVSKGKCGPVASFLSAVERLPAVVERLRCTQILCGDWQRAIECTDTPDCLHYLDPPYIPDTRRAGEYAHELTVECHERLVAYLLSDTVQGMVLLSGYAHPLYEPLEAAGWRRTDWATSCSAAARTRGTGLLGTGVLTAQQQRTESVWSNPAAQARQDLLYGEAV